MIAAPAECVVDASVAVKLVLPEDLADQATGLFSAASRGDVTMWAPDLFDAECASAVLEYSRRFGTAHDETAADLADLRDLPIRRVRLLSLVQPAARLALALGLSVYDGCYLALAVSLGIALITADESLQRAAHGPSRKIVHLATLGG